MEWVLLALTGAMCYYVYHLMTNEVESSVEETPRYLSCKQIGTRISIGSLIVAVIFAYAGIPCIELPLFIHIASTQMYSDLLNGVLGRRSA